jgi:hypothetical protein
LAAGTLLKTTAGGEFVEEDRQPARTRQTAKINGLSFRKMSQRDFIDPALRHFTVTWNYKLPRRERRRSEMHAAESCELLSGICYRTWMMKENRVPRVNVPIKLLLSSKQRVH